MKKFRSVLCIILALATVLLTFSACGKKKDKGGDTDDKLGANSGFVYVPEYLKLSDDIGSIVGSMDNVISRGDKLFFTATVPVRPDGTVLTQEELEEIQEQWQAYYEAMDSSVAVPVPRVAAVASATDLAEPASEGLDEDFGVEPPDEDYSYESRLYSINKDGTGLASLPDFVPIEMPEGDYNYSNINRLLAGKDNSLWVMERVQITNFDLPEGFDPETQDMWEYYESDENKYYLRSINETGAEQNRICINDIVDTSDRDWFYIDSIIADDDGNLFFSDDGNLYGITPDGSVGCKLELSDCWINGFARLKDGRIAAYCYMNQGDASNVMRVVDIKAGSWGDTLTAPRSAWNFYPGDDSYDFYFDSNGTLMGYSADKQDSDVIVNWLNNDINGDYIRYVEVQKNGDLYVIANNYDEDGPSAMEVINLVKTPADQVPAKKVITLATSYLDYEIRSAILKFNKSSADSRVEVRDYSVYNTEDDYTAGITKLNTEIISGNVPDLISISQLPYKQYAAKGLLEDLYAYIDNDSQFSRDDFMSGVLKAMEIDGKLYYSAPSFTVMTLVGNPDVVGPEQGWTMEELKSIIDQNPQADCFIGQAVSRESIFNELFVLCVDDYVNWNTGECRFDTPAFKSLLEFAKSFPTQDSIDYENIDWQDEDVLLAEGRQLVTSLYLYDFESYQQTSMRFGGKMVVKGLPISEGVGSVANVSSGLAMTTSCSDKEAAWSFLRTFLTEEYQKNVWNLPTNKNVFEDKLAEAMKQEYDSEGNPIPKYSYWTSMAGSDEGQEVNVYAISEEEAAAVRALIDTVQFTGDYDESLLGIINDEAAAFFNGEKSVDDVASIIQSRMKIYVNEQR